MVVLSLSRQKRSRQLKTQTRTEKNSQAPRFLFGPGRSLCSYWKVVVAAQFHQRDRWRPVEAEADRHQAPESCEKTAFLSHVYIKTIILPRQARDKHRENSEKDAVFRTAGLVLACGEGDDGTPHDCLCRVVPAPANISG